MTVPPNAGLLARGAGAGDLEWVSRVTGERLRALGLDWVYAPVADLGNEPANPIIATRSPRRRRCSSRWIRTAVSCSTAPAP
jgi:beta-glucosidase-like glycosyl hydrolase